MNEIGDQTQKLLDGTAIDGMLAAFAAYMLAHASHSEELAEFRLDENTIASKCLRCDEVRTFGSAHRSARNRPGFTGREANTHSE
jgi:hypothetical protein